MAPEGKHVKAADPLRHRSMTPTLFVVILSLFVVVLYRCNYVCSSSASFCSCVVSDIVSVFIVVSLWPIFMRPCCVTSKWFVSFSI